MIAKNVEIDNTNKTERHKHPFSLDSMHQMVDIFNRSKEMSIPVIVDFVADDIVGFAYNLRVENNSLIVDMRVLIPKELKCNTFTVGYLGDVDDCELVSVGITSHPLNDTLKPLSHYID